MAQPQLPSQDSLGFVAKLAGDEFEYEELGMLAIDSPPVPSWYGIPLKYIS